MTQNVQETKNVPAQESKDLLWVSVSPHLKGKKTTQSIMLDVIIALLPISVAATVLFGLRVLALIATAVITCVVSEFLFNKMTGRDNTVTDLSAVVTGLILALNVPATLPLWQLAFGSVAAICMVKGLFGGLGQNFANPAVTARILLFVSFSTNMCAKSVSRFATAELYTSATPLKMIADGNFNQSLLDMLLGNHTTSAVGETCIVAILVGFVYLLVKKIITWHTPVFFVGTVYLFSLLVSFDPYTSLELILSGGLIFGAVFMATDYATTPTTYIGRAVFGIGCGIITFIIRQYGSLPEGVSLSILFMNILTPYIEQLCRHRPLGGAK